MTEVTITDADREAAANAIAVQSQMHLRAAVLRGDHDRSEAVKAFARHRTTAIAERDARIAELEAENARLREDRARLDWLRSEMNDVRWVSGHGNEMCSPSDEVGVRIVSHHMAEPCERIEAENWNEDLRSAIDEARAALKEIEHG